MKRINFHVIVIPLFFIFYLFAQNLNKVGIEDILLSLLIVFISSVLIYFFLYRICHSFEKAAFLASIFFIFFFNLDSITKLSLLILNKIVQHTEVPAYQQASKACAIILSILYCFIFLIILISKKEPRTANRMANIFAIGLIGIVMGSSTVTLIQQRGNEKSMDSNRLVNKWHKTLEAEPNYLQASQTLPDIYYIVLDGYGRDDILEKFYGFDNQSFLNSLKDLGLSVAKDSRANYKQTNPALASLLNMDFINWLEEDYGDAFDYSPLNTITRDNRVVDQLSRLGYRVNTFATGNSEIEFIAADELFHPTLYPNEFEMLVITTTPLWLLWNSQLHNIHREQVRFTLNYIAEAGTQVGPDFVFAHIISPHPPFVFGANGESITPDHPYSTFDASDFMLFGTLEEYRTGYTNQVSYINQEILKTVQEIFEKSNTPPIIIIHGDHGPGSQFNTLTLESDHLEERYAILYASYIPCGSDNPIPNDITPVNSFRYIFNTCFNSDFPYLENSQYFASSLSPFALTNVTQYLNEKY
ncbi:hypothetical protein LARV_01273 [Longilinea arvoryzae]|uniref:Sulfatase N-terminal domain-containing protein n=1 Tax=Longilinea arvoryzae TaxID=360412 RepID=A0A0S7B7W4_9CHLR|nr:hypothetical protein [Longilinea arvoryzae]GAP13519.1 hypothetical protein LARV_01273 [Longilinea arvoryzae]